VKLRARLLLTTAASAVPLVAALGWVQFHFLDRAAADSLASFIRAGLDRAGREVCEASPERWAEALSPPGAGPPLPPLPPGPLGPPGLPGRPRPPPPPGIRVFAYELSGRSRDPSAPPLPARLLSQLGEGRAVARAVSALPGGEVDDLLLRTAWPDGPCALVMARRRIPPFNSAVRSFLPPLEIWAPPVVLMLAGLLVAAGPVVGRIRGLTRRVTESARTGYRDPVGPAGSDEIGDLARAFDDAGRQIREQMEAQAKRERTLRDFLENTTHDVMIPLTVLQGHLAALQSGAAADGEAVSGAMREAHYMASLIHNLSVAAKLEAGEPAQQRADVNLGEVLQRAVSRHQPIARRSGVSLEMAAPPEKAIATGDVTLVEQALSNVIYNAVRYNREGGHVAAVLERSGARFVVRVIDDGPGIPEVERSRLVERYFRGNEARSRAPEGRGLGLNIAFRVAALHGWELKLSEAEGGGLQVELAGALVDRPAPVSPPPPRD